MRSLLRQLSLGAALVGGIALIPACGGDDTSSSGAAGHGGSGGGGGGAGGAGGASTDEFPPPQVAGTPETDPLAASPERCGQPAYAWRKDAELGSVTAHEPRASYTKAVLEALIAAAGITLPTELQYDVETHLVTYTTQDRGKLIDATGVLAWPTNVPDGTEPLPTLLVLHGTSGFTDGCGASADANLTAIAAAVSSAGYIVLLPDYIGLKATPPPTGFLHPYLAGQATAIASLDAVRVLGHLPDEIRVGGARPSPRVVVVGGSQGGHAALWVDRLAPYYARELELVGVAAMVPPADLLTEGELALTTLRPSTTNIIAFTGAVAGWYGAEATLDQVLLPPLDQDVPAALGASCDPPDPTGGATSLDQIFQPGVLAAASSGMLEAEDPWGCIVAENGLLTTSIARINKDAPSYGVLFITGEADTLVDTPTERAAFESLCGSGTPATYLECAGASHTDTTIWALPDILTFLDARLAGEAFSTACTAGTPVTCAGTP